MTITLKAFILKVKKIYFHKKLKKLVKQKE